MKTCSLPPNLNRETTSYPNFFTSVQDPADPDSYPNFFTSIQDPADPDDNDTTLNKRPKTNDTTLNKRPKTNDTEPSETSPFKGILSTPLSSGEMNVNHHRIVGFFPEWDQMDWPSSPNGSDTNVSVGSNPFEDILCPFNSSDGRTALNIAKMLARAADYYKSTVQEKASPKDRLCIEILEQAERRDPSLAKAEDDLRIKALYLEGRVALVKLLFPMEAKVAMYVGLVDGTSEHLNIRALAKTVELVGLFFPCCSEVINDMVDCDDLSELLCLQNRSREERQLKKAQFMEIVEAYTKAFDEGKEELDNKSINISSSSRDSRPVRGVGRPNGNDCANLNRETTSFPNFFTFIQDHADPDDNDITLNKRPKTNDTEPSETSPFKGILSTSLSSGEMNVNHHRIVGFFPEWDQMDWPPSPNGSDTNVSVGSNPFEDILWSFNSSDGRTALKIAKVLTRAADYYKSTVQGKASPKDRLWIEVFEQAERRDPLLGEASASLAMAEDDPRMKALYLEGRGNQETKEQNPLQDDQYQGEDGPPS